MTARKRNKKSNKKMLIISLCFFTAIFLTLSVYITNLFVKYEINNSELDKDNKENFLKDYNLFDLINGKNDSSNSGNDDVAKSKTNYSLPVADNKIDEIAAVSNYKNFSYEIIYPANYNTRGNDRIIFGHPDNYSKLSGITCFRGNNYRDSASFGYIKPNPEKLEIKWSLGIGAIDIWTGVGWTGQPAIIEWPDYLKKNMNIFENKKTKKYLKEVIYATLDGNIYFIDLDDGKYTRNPIKTKYPHKGSITVDPHGIPLLYAGQGIPERNGVKGPIKFRIFSLIDQQLLYSIDGYDKDAYRKWGAFDSGALLHQGTDTLIQCGENGIVYIIKLNTDYNDKYSKIAISPEIIKYRYKSPYGSKIGIENSPSAYKNYLFFADNSGLLQCLDLITLKPVWLYNLKDDTDSSIVIDEEDGNPFIYTGSEVDRQGAGGKAYIRKFDALTGKLVWEKSYPCYYDSHTNGGILATPVSGKKDIENIVIFNIAKTARKKSGGLLTALDKNTGSEIWKVELDSYSWSSPVAVYDSNGNSYIIICDSGGNVKLLKGSTGNVITEINIGSNIEGSPAVYENMIVVGTRGRKIVCIEIL